MHHLKRGQGTGIEKRQSYLQMRPWMLLVLVGVIGLAAHSAVLYYALSHTRASVPVVSGVIILVVIKHLGLLGPLYAWFRRRSRQQA
jgi:drug/metabolite transporter (DMT)-like permease